MQASGHPVCKLVCCMSVWLRATGLKDLWLRTAGIEAFSREAQEFQDWFRARSYATCRFLHLPQCLRQLLPGSLSLVMIPSSTAWPTSEDFDGRQFKRRCGSRAQKAKTQFLALGPYFHKGTLAGNWASELEALEASGFELQLLGHGKSC